VRSDTAFDWAVFGGIAGHDAVGDVGGRCKGTARPKAGDAGNRAETHRAEPGVEGGRRDAVSFADSRAHSRDRGLCRAQGSPAVPVNASRSTWPRPAKQSRGGAGTAWVRLSNY